MKKRKNSRGLTFPTTPWIRKKDYSSARDLSSTRKKNDDGDDDDNADDDDDDHCDEDGDVDDHG